MTSCIRRFLLSILVVAASTCLSQAAQSHNDRQPILDRETRERFHLRFDQKLQGKVTVEGIDHTLAGLLALLKKATDLTLTVDPKVGKHEPDFGHIQLPKVSCWSIMELIASRELEEGRWIKTADGYQLTAKRSLVPPPSKEKPKAKLSSLRADPALQVEVALTGPGLTLAQLMADLQKATGRRLTVDPQLGEHQPVFHQKVQKGPAWAVMQMMAVRQLTEGRWEKTADGYQLTAKESTFAKMTAIDDANKTAQAKSAATAAEFAKAYPLKLDPKLRAKLNVVEQDPKLTDLMTRLEVSTSLKLSLTDNLIHHDPQLGNLQMPNAAAYMLMELIAKKDIDNGRWVKTAKGYELTGVSKLPTPAVSKLPMPVKLPGEGVLPEPDAKSGGLSPWLIGGGAVFGIALLGLASFIVFRRPRRLVAEGSRKSQKARGGLR